MDIFLHNTLTRRKERFQPLHGRAVSIYTCGPTVYAEAHLGNLRSYLFPDVLKKLLTAAGSDVKHVINITDVGHLTSDADSGEDKLESAARSAQQSAWDLAEHYRACFTRDLAALHVASPALFPKATAHIPEQIALIEILCAKGYTYQTSDGLYFDTTRFPQYGALARLKAEGLQAGIRVEQGEKRCKTDFALWKRSTPEMKRQMEWASPWGVGFPGWHIECSAMAAAHLGETIDIHTGGMDHIPVHHTNEIAQSEAAHDKPLARYWLHGAFLVMDAHEKTRMGKSEGNVVTLPEVLQQGMDALSFRYLALGSHYRQYLQFSQQALHSAATGLRNLQKLIQRQQLPLPAPEPDWHAAARSAGLHAERYPFLAAWFAALCDDLNTPRALGLLWEALQTEDIDRQEKAMLVHAADAILSLNLSTDAPAEAVVAIPADIMAIAEQRQKARLQKQYAESDRLRQVLLEAGFSVRDGRDGYTLQPVSSSA